VAWEQLALLPGSPTAGVARSPRPLDVKQVDGRVVVSGPDFAAAFENGSLASYRWKGEERLAGPLVPHLWRVPTDNDEGGGRASFAHRWREAGLDRVKVTARAPRIEKPAAGVVRVLIDSRLQGTGAAAMNVATAYEIGSDGSIGVTANFQVDGELPPLPRVGFQVQLPDSTSQVEWYGRGPHESYGDRKTGARIGVYRAKAADMHFPHVMAQENGNRTDVRWVKLTAPGGAGLAFSGAPFDFTAHDYTDEALLASKKSQRIERDGRVTLSLDLAQMGLGGDDSWAPRVHREFQLTKPAYRFAFRLEPVR
jgi:beta-galactosidase